MVFAWFEVLPDELFGLCEDIFEGLLQISGFASIDETMIDREVNVHNCLHLNLLSNRDRLIDDFVDRNQHWIVRER